MLYIVFALLIGLPVLGVMLAFFMKWLAEENILFTTCKEGTVKAIMRGQTFERFSMSFDDYHLNDPGKIWYQKELQDWEVVYHGKDNDNKYETRWWALRKLGLYWVGWPWAHSVYVYVFKWNETYTAASGEEKVLVRTEATDFIFVADFTYAVVTTGAETKERLQTDELTLVTIAIRNPYRALFFGEDWMRRVTSSINRYIRQYVGNIEYKDLVSSAHSTDGKADFSTRIKGLNELLPDETKEDALPNDSADKSENPGKGLLGRYGVKIRNADLQTIALSGDAQKIHEEATTREYTSAQEAVAIKNLGQANADVIKMMGETEAEALEKRLQIIARYGEAGLQLAGYDALQNASKGPGTNIVWANDPLKGLTSVLTSVAKKPELPAVEERALENKGGDES